MNREEDANHLPDWIFDIIEDDDDIDYSKTLLEELEIDPKHIYINIYWMLTASFYFTYRLLKKNTSFLLSNNSIDSNSSLPKIHPLHSSNTGTIDFWGPFTMISIYGLMVGKTAPWIYLIWIAASLLNHLVCRVCSTYPKFMLHFAILGYSISPIIPISTFIIFIHPNRYFSTILEITSIILSSSAAILAYRMITKNSNFDDRRRLYLVIPSTILYHIYLLSLLPV
jgi:hypothetical protein